MVRPATLAIDVGGTGLKASVLDAGGRLITHRVRVPTTYPCPPERLVDMLATLVAPHLAVDRSSARTERHRRDQVRGFAR